MKQSTTICSNITWYGNWLLHPTILEKSSHHSSLHHTTLPLLSPSATTLLFEEAFSRTYLMGFRILLSEHISCMDILDGIILIFGIFFKSYSRTHCTHSENYFPKITFWKFLQKFCFENFVPEYYFEKLIRKILWII